MANKAPTTKLSTMRVLWGILAGMFILLLSPMNLMNGNTVLGIAQLLVGAWAGWYAISPPAYIKKKFIQ